LYSHPPFLAFPHTPELPKVAQTSIMRWKIPLTSFFLSHVTAESMAVSLNMTALSSRNGYSVLECWQLSSIPVDYMSAVNYAVGNTTTATWSRIEPRVTVGVAWAPHVQ
jgi:hypothetical protein